MKKGRLKLSLFEITLFSLLGAVMFVTKFMLEFLPNIHLLALFIVSFTLVFRTKALVPIYVFVFINGIVEGFTAWWIPYLYIWTALWAVTMLLPKKMPKCVAVPVYMVVCALHGFLYGTLFAPVQALLFGLDFKGTVAWIVAGFPFDFIHGVSNFIVGSLVLPLSLPLKKLYNSFKK